MDGVCDVVDIAKHAEEKPPDHPNDRVGWKVEAGVWLVAALHPEVSEQAVYDPRHAAEPDTRVVVLENGPTRIVPHWKSPQ